MQRCTAMTNRIIYLCSGERVDGCLDACKVPFSQGVLSEHVPAYALDVLRPGGAALAAAVAVLGRGTRRDLLIRTSAVCTVSHVHGIRVAPSCLHLRKQLLVFCHTSAKCEL